MSQKISIQSRSSVEGAICSCCHSEIFHEVALACHSCGTLFHEDCFEDLGRCSTLGCDCPATVSVGRTPMTIETSMDWRSEISVRGWGRRLSFILGCSLLVLQIYLFAFSDGYGEMIAEWRKGRRFSRSHGRLLLSIWPIYLAILSFHFSRLLEGRKH